MKAIQNTKSRGTRTKNLRRRSGGYQPIATILSKLQADRGNHLRELEILRATLLELPKVSVEEADPAIAEHALTIATIQRVEDHLAEIDQAIESAQRADYGICEKCSEPIDPERLAILPETRLCIKCKREAEKFQQHHFR